MDVSSIKSKTDVINYLDEQRHQGTGQKNRVWKGANITQRTGLNKRWQWHSALADNLCQGCMKPIADNKYPLRQCRADEMFRARNTIWEQADQSISKARKNLHNALHSITRPMREDEGGEIACCGTFRCDLVSKLPCANLPISEMEGKVMLKLLKTIAAGIRRLLRLSAEIQLAPLGINSRQTALTDFYKPIPRKSSRAAGGTGGKNPKPRDHGIR